MPNKIPDMLKELGYTNVCVRRNAIPMGRWHADARIREMGIFNQIINTEWMRTMLHRHDEMGISGDEAAALGQEILDAFNDPDIHAAIVWMDCWAQKPE